MNCIIFKEKINIIFRNSITKMGRTKQLSQREKGKIDAYTDLKLTKRDIARRLRRSVHVITNYLKNKQNYGRNYNTGRPKLLTSMDLRRLKRAASNSSKTINNLRYELNLQVSRATISRRLKDISIKYEKVKRQMSLTQAHIKQREVFCRKYMKQNWSKIWFTDEKMWCLDSPDRVGHY